VDPRGAPQWVLLAHSTDEIEHLMFLVLAAGSDAGNADEMRLFAMSVEGEETNKSATIVSKSPELVQKVPN
jgi:hypothetical protein